VITDLSLYLLCVPLSAVDLSLYLLCPFICWVPGAPDQLTSVPDGGMTLAMLGMACSSFGLMRRKFAFSV
jgi:hypothetical protein